MHAWISRARPDFDDGVAGIFEPSLRRFPRGRSGRVIEDRRQPFLRLGERPILARGIILDLVALDPADAEISALRMAEIDAAHRGARPHGKAFGEPHAD